MSQIQINQFNINNINDKPNLPPSNTQGFIFTIIPELNSFLFIGGNSASDFGLFLYNLNTNNWTKQQTCGIPFPPIHYCAYWYNSPYLFLHGGKSLTENKSLNETFLLEIPKFQLFKVFTMENPTSRYGHSGCIDNEKHAYIFGGCNIGKKNERYLADLHKLEYKGIKIVEDESNVNGASWITNIATKGEKPSGRKNYGMVFLSNVNSLVIFGGEIKGEFNDNNFYLFDIDSKEFKKIAVNYLNDTKIESCFGLKMVCNSLNNLIFVFGGKNLFEIDLDFNCKNYELNNFDRFDFNAFEILDEKMNSNLIFMGGKNSNKKFYNNDLFNITILNDEENKKKNKIPISKNKNKNNKNIINDNNKILKENYINQLNELKNKFISVYKKNKNINNEYAKNKLLLNKKKNSELEEKLLANINKKDKQLKLYNFKYEFEQINKKKFENDNLNNIIEDYLILMKDRFNYISEILGEIVNNVSDIEKILIDNFIDDSDMLISKRNSYKISLKKTLIDLKKYSEFEKKYYNFIIEKENKKKNFN